MENRQALIADITRWIENSQRAIEGIRAELVSSYAVNPAQQSARMAENYAKIEAWEQVLNSLSDRY